MSNFQHSLMLNGNGMSNVSGSSQLPKSDYSRWMDVDCRRTTVSDLAGATPSCDLLRRPYVGCPTTAKAPCSIPSGRGSSTPTMICYGHGCLVAELTKEQDSQPQTASKRTKRPSQRQFTSLRSHPAITDNSVGRRG